MAKVTRRSFRKARSASDSLMQLPTSDYSSGNSETASEKEIEDNLPPPIKLLTVPSRLGHNASLETRISLSSDIAPSAITQTKKRLCPFCPYIASSSSLYMKHLSCHDKEVSPYPQPNGKSKKLPRKECPHCSYSTRAHGRLDAHLKSHFNFSSYLISQGIEVSHGMVWEPSDEIAIELMDQDQGNS